MFQKGEKIIYGSKGVFEVEDITTIQTEGVPGDRLYYVLRPLNVSGSMTYTPVDNDRVVMRPLITRPEAEHLIEEIPEIEELRVTSEKQREQTYKECIRTASCREYIRIIKTLTHRKTARLNRGKKITATDERYLKQAEDALFSEFSVLFSVPQEEMPRFINEKLREDRPKSSQKSAALA